MISTTTTFTRLNRDRVRQILNVVLALGQIVITVLGYIVGSNSSFTSNNPTTTTQVLPADYTFSIWAVIFLGALVYAIYQALPQQRENTLLRRIGFSTASAYLATCVWLIAAQSNVQWFTAICIFWILISLVGAFIQFIKYGPQFTITQQYFVVLPTSIYAGWATVATIANTATVLKQGGFHNVILSDQVWAIVMLGVGGLIAAFVTLRSKGNIGYAVTVIWALIGIVVNANSSSNIPVVLVSSLMAVLIAFILLLARIVGHKSRREGNHMA